MQYPDLAAYLDRLKDAPPKAPVCLIMAEDEVEIASTLSHHLAAGFGTVILLTPPEIGLPEGFEDRVHHAPHDVFAEAALPQAVNRLNAALPAGTWVYYCYNAEYLFIPFGETRNVREMLAFHTEERRSAMLTYVIDLYAADLAHWLWVMLFGAPNCRAYNVGGADSLSIRDLAYRVNETLGGQGSVRIAQTPPAGAVPQAYLPDLTRIEKELGLVPRVSLDDAIRRTAQWARQNSEE